MDQHPMDKSPFLLAFAVAVVFALCFAGTVTWAEQLHRAEIEARV